MYVSVLVAFVYRTAPMVGYGKITRYSIAKGRVHRGLQHWLLRTEL
jgi:hypothetical protein